MSIIECKSFAGGHRPRSGPAPTGPAIPRGASPEAIIVPHLGREIQAKIASRTEELEQAFQLLAENYRARGYEAPGPMPLRFAAHHALPGTATFVALHRRRVVATLSLVPDTDLLGLPMEDAFRTEVGELRRHGRRLAESTGLADRGLSLREFLAVFKALIRLTLQYHLRQGGDTWVMAVHPRHLGLYRKLLGAVPLGERRPYPGARNHPAEACLLDVALMKHNAPGMYREMLSDPLPESVLTPGGWSAERIRDFGRRSTQVDPGEIETILGVVERSGSPPRWSASPLGSGRRRSARGGEGKRRTSVRRGSCFPPPGRDGLRSRGPGPPVFGC